MTKLNDRFNRPTDYKNVRRIVGLLLLLLTLFSLTSSKPFPTKTPTQNEPSSENRIKQNPLILLVKIQRDYKITLNNEEMGSVSDMLQLSKRLSDLFKYRAEMGIFKPGTPETEKTVIVKSDRAVKYGDYVKVVKAILDAGASPVGLVTDEKKVPLDPNARPEASRRDIPDEVQETSQTTPKEEPKPTVSTRMELISSAGQGATAFVNRVRQEQSVDPAVIRKSVAVVEVRGIGEYYLDGKRIEKTSLYQTLKDRFKDVAEEDGETYIVARGDLDYGVVEDAINEAWEANQHLILVTAPLQSTTSMISSTNWTLIIFAIVGGIILLGLALFAVTKLRR